MSNNSNSRVVVITGGSRGIGRCIALQFAAEKARIVLLHYDADDSAADETLQMLAEQGCRLKATVWIFLPMKPPMTS